MLALFNEGTLEVGQVIRMAPNGPPFRVQSVTPSRAYCIPLRKVLAKRGPDEVEFEGAHEGINISPRSFVEIITGDLADEEKKRRTRMSEEKAAKESADGSDSPISGEDKESDMTASAMPVRSNREENRAMKGRVASRKAAMPRKLSGAAAKAAGKGRVKTPKTVRKCFCGCGEETMSFFAPGHDGRFHGLMKKLERGEIEPSGIRKSIAEVIGPFKKFGEGWRPSKNYKGEAYKPH